MKKVLIAPSILSADFANLAKDIKIVENAGADWLHIDVMDGHFVPNISIGPVVVKNIRLVSKLFFDVHLMIDRPDIYWKDFKEAGADLIVFHCESKVNIKRLINTIRSSNIKVGLSLKPKTPISKIMPYLKMIDVILVMSVEPGFGGQKFMADMMPKVQTLRAAIDKVNPKCRLQVDGGINSETAVVCVKAGADALVAGNAIFSGASAKNNLKGLRRTIDKASF